MDASWPKKAADSFWLAAARNFEQRRINPAQHQALLIPGVVCMAFSIELGIKAMILPAGIPPKTHNLAKLFIELPSNIQNKIIAACGTQREMFFDALSKVANSFEDWRYVYEMENPTIDLSFLSALADAVREATDACAS